MQLKEESMKFKPKHIIVMTMLFSLFNCEKKSQSKKIEEESFSIQKKAKLKNSFHLKESENKTDNPANEYLSEELKPIRENFKKLNSTKLEWSQVKTEELLETNEGGEVTYYYWNIDLSKIITKQYGETFQVLTEYYFLDKKISFVFEKLYTYSRPVYHDKSAMKEMNDKEAFDFNKSEITETRSYFSHGKLIHQSISDDCGSPFSESYLQNEQRKIENNLNNLLKIEK